MASQSGVPTREQSISFEGRDLTNSKSTMAELGVGDDAVLLLRRKVTVAGRYVVSSIQSCINTDIDLCTISKVNGTRLRDDETPNPWRS